MVFQATALLVMANTGMDPHIEMHPAGQPLPFQHMGPFVTRGDGAVLAVDSREALVSRDAGATWVKRPLFRDSTTFSARPERALLRTRSGVVLFGFLNQPELHRDKEVPKNNFLPTYVTRSTDDGETWEEPRKLQDGWCGAVRHMIQLKSGRVVLPAQNSLYEPWRHVALSFVSDDDGRTWQRSNLIELKGAGSHAGAMEPTVTELGDGRLYMLIRTSQPWEGRVWFWEAFSSDGGLTWTDVRNSGILASTCCGTLTRLADGRVALLWNRPEQGKPYAANTRAELSLTFSSDDCRSWSRPVVVSRRPLQTDEEYYMARQSYPYAYEAEPGVLWVTTMQGGLRMKLPVGDIEATPDLERLVRPTTVVALGSSTTARRSGVAKVYEQRLAEAFPEARFINAGVPSDTTERARSRLDADVLAHRPDIVIVQLGANDAAIDVWRGATVPRVAPERYEENLRHIVKAVSEHGGAPVLATAGMFRWTPKLREMYGKPPYDPDDPDGFNLKLREYAEIARRVARQEKVPLVDLFKAHEAYDAVDGQSADGLLLDGMHPNDVGHELAAGMLAPVIRELLARGRPAE